MRPRQFFIGLSTAPPGHLLRDRYNLLANFGVAEEKKKTKIYLGLKEALQSNIHFDDYVIHL